MDTANQLVFRGILRDAKEVKPFLDNVRTRNSNLPVAIARVKEEYSGI